MVISFRDSFVVFSRYGVFNPNTGGMSSAPGAPAMSTLMRGLRRTRPRAVAALKRARTKR